LSNFAVGGDYVVFGVDRLVVLEFYVALAAVVGEFGDADVHFAFGVEEPFSLRAFKA
jgi:hypothetical protein